MSVPLGQEILLQIGRALALGASGLMVTLLAVGAVGYLWMCFHACRQWNGHEERWARPPGSRR